MVQEFDRVGVVGLGTMGAGIVEVFARAGFNVTGVEVDDDALRRGRSLLENSLSKAVSRGKLTEDEQRAILNRVSFAISREQLGDADFVVEAVPERAELKREVFTDLDRVCGRGTILATNTSSLSVTEIAAFTSRPDRVIGLHFFNPAPVMKLVEVVSTVVTDPEAVTLGTEVAKRVGKTPVVVSDRAGFVANALLVPYLNHAVSLYEHRLASRTEIDNAVTEAAGLPMGPLALFDMIGLDVGLAVLDVLAAEFQQPRYVAAPLLRRMVAAGLHGRKTGRGFYDYAGDTAPEDEAAPTNQLAEMLRNQRPGFGLAELLLAPHIDDAVRMVSDGYASVEDVDTAMRFGCGYPKGPLELLEERGAQTVAAQLRGIADAGLSPGYAPAPLLVLAEQEGKPGLR
ncbi:3-hydroxybutyryl-CoA dehydrogenase [Lipingzhangella sp. LS1_29]|uniref:3-hydroxybutyryl-CoA dehydrogenase n=1 Tax=Lipingzhangella rawalii TaxID=2055835 RepID=A0ABU2H6N5_9ACTN|nr:3-hydroxybutyryl-CoA dehydrogenase [Lipingzhangella rawalii]MDS1270485.1 3-hydroxybutyryl-CoA dehydrogenase [Lipingzhangella rawalii]